VSSIVHVGQRLVKAFPVHSRLKQGHILLPLLFNFTLKYTIKKMQENQKGLEINDLKQVFIYADYIESLW
jgi:hypothetical protein